MTAPDEMNTNLPEPDRRLVRRRPVLISALLGATTAAVVGTIFRTATPDAPIIAIVVVGAYIGPLGGLFGRAIGAKIHGVNRAPAVDTFGCAVATAAGAATGLLAGAQHGARMGENPALFSAMVGLLIGLSLGLLAGGVISLVGRLIAGVEA